MKEKKRLCSRAALARLLALGIGLTWLASMALLTVVTAQEVYDKLYTESCAFPRKVEQWGELDEYYSVRSPFYGTQREQPDRFEYNVLDAIRLYTDNSISSAGHYADYREHGKLLRDIRYPMETAVLFYDGTGILLHSSEEDVMFFCYYTQDEWNAGTDAGTAPHYGWIDISEGKDAESWQDDPYLRFRTLFAGTHRLHEVTALRLTGSFSGTEFMPERMDYLMDGQFRDAWEQQIGDAAVDDVSCCLSDLDRAGILDWQCQFDNTGPQTDSGLVTIYAVTPEMWDYPKTAFSYDGEEYESLAALTKTLDFPSWAADSFYFGQFSGMGKYELGELLVFSGRKYADYEGFDYASGGEPEPEYYLVTAIRSHPLRCAVSALQNLYILTGLAALILFLSIRGSIRKHLTEPLERLTDAVSGEKKIFYRPEDAPMPWREAEVLSDHYVLSADRQQRNENELTRLQTALDYAKNAEQNRRAMVSALAHELKTPLAVIHSYAEGLKEHIAEEKREKYLDTILSEAERTDALVLEMLDLSRLEAGKVKLSRDEFDLTELIRSVFEKQHPAMAAKGLEAVFDLPEELNILADENRIGQVVENFATNAVKYSEANGTILVRAARRRGEVRFSVENPCAPLSPEALSKVWDSFYRADTARDRSGTGLGLAISKNIIELHGGTCFVRNTEAGAEFGFSLPG